MTDYQLYRLLYALRTCHEDTHTWYNPTYSWWRWIKYSNWPVVFNDDFENEMLNK